LCVLRGGGGLPRRARTRQQEQMGKRRPEGKKDDDWARNQRRRGLRRGKRLKGEAKERGSQVPVLNNFFCGGQKSATSNHSRANRSAERKNGKEVITPLEWIAF